MRASLNTTSACEIEPERARRRRAHTSLRTWFVAAIGIVAAALSFWGVAVIRQARGRLDEARTHGGTRDVVRFERKRSEPLSKVGVRLFQSTQTVRAVARFKDSYFVATDGGLVELSALGQVARRYSVLDGLGESDLTCLAAYGARLYIGTRSRGLVAFDGEHFERYRWTDRDAQTVAALLEDGGKLLVGTFAGGLLEFDGESFREVRAGEPGATLNGITSLSRYGSRLYVGTFGKGLWVTEGGRWAHFTTADGLKSDRVVGVVESGGETLVASDFGLAATAADALVLTSETVARERWRDVATIPSLSGIADLSGQVFLCKDNGEVAPFDLSSRAPSNGKAEEIIWSDAPAAQSGARLVVLDGYLWLMGSAGIRRAALPATGATGRRAARLTFADFGGQESRQSPTANAISALAFDAGGNLWVGSFRNGVDVFAPSGVKLAHLETEELREINAIVPEGERAVLAATSQGIIRLDSALHASRLNTADGLASNSVLHVALLHQAQEKVASSSFSKSSIDQPGRTSTDEQIVVATSRGLSLGTPGKLRALTTVQGLPSNSVYAVWSDAEHIYAGTLGGLAEISAGRVVHVFKDANSSLTNNWVTAICNAGGRLFVGTYGGGVYELLPSGELHSFATETGKAFVNQNAMWSDAERLYVGTLDGALIFDLRSQKWARLRDELPMPTVLSVTGRDGQIYFGTTGGLARFDASFFDRAD